MMPSPSDASDAARIEQEAAEWIARHYAGLSAAERSKFQHWQALDPRHAAVFAELEAIWRALDGVRQPSQATGRIDADVLAPESARVGWRFALTLAAAVVILASAVWWRAAPNERTPYAGAVATAVGELRNVELPDGSTVLVNTNTRIETAYSAAERRVRLVHGEAHFTVAKNPARPFYVDANGVAVRAVGTAFNVRLRSDSVEVLVTEGRVRVADTTRGTSLIAEKSVQVSADDAPLLRAGERAVVAGSVAPGGVRQPVPAAAVTASEVGRVLAWQDRRLEFGAVPLSEIVAEFNRYNRVQLIVEEPALAAQRFGGSFRVDQPDTLVRLLEDRFGVRAERSKAEIVLRRGPASAP